MERLGELTSLMGDVMGVPSFYQSAEVSIVFDINEYLGQMTKKNDSRVSPP